MRSLVVVLTAVLCLAVSGCQKNVNPDTPLPPTGAVLSKVGVTCRFKVTASDADFHRVSVRVDWDDGDTSDWSQMFRSGDTMTLEYAWPVPGDFRISAQAKDEKDAVSLWSNWHAVAIADTVSLPPGSPRAPAGPDTGYIDSTYEFSTLAGDPNGDRIRLQLDWGDGDTSAWGGLVPESTMVTMSHTWLSAGEYSVRARAKDEKDLVGEWSGVHILMVIEDTVSRPPGVPLVPAGPDTGYVDSAYEFSTAGGDPNGDSILFQFDWGDGDTSNWSAPVSESTAVRIAHSWTAAGDFSIRARAKDTKDLMSDWSNAHLLTVNDSLWNRLRMVGSAEPTPDSSAFRIYVVNDQPDDVTISWLHFFQTPDSAYMRDFHIDGSLGTGFPLAPTDSGIGDGDTVHFASVTIAPNGSQLVELLMQQFYPVAIPAPPNDTLGNVCNREFQLRFSDGSEIKFVVPYP